MPEKVEGHSNPTGEAANPYCLILSKEERDVIFGILHALDNKTNSLLEARVGWRPQLKSAITAAAEIAFVGLVLGLPASILMRSPIDFRAASVFFTVLAFLILWKLNLLLAHETIDQMFARRDREDKREAKERSQYFRDMGSKDMSLDE